MVLQRTSTRRHCDVEWPEFAHFLSSTRIKAHQLQRCLNKNPARTLTIWMRHWYMAHTLRRTFAAIKDRRFAQKCPTKMRLFEKEKTLRTYR